MQVERQPIRLVGKALRAAEKLIDLKEQYAVKRAEILARYQEEMDEFASDHSSEVSRLFGEIHAATKTNQPEGWIVDGSQTGAVVLCPVVPESAVAAMLERHDSNHQTH